MISIQSLLFQIMLKLLEEKERQKIEVTIPVKGNIIRSEQTSNDMYVSIDLVEEVIERQLRKYKNKLVARSQGHPTAASSPSDFKKEFFESEDEVEEDGEIRIVRTKKFGIKPMHFFGLLGSLMFLIGMISVIIVGVSKLYAMYNGLPYRLVTDSPYFYLSLTAMIIGTQLFLAGFLGELISRNAPERNNYQIEKKI